MSTMRAARRVTGRRAEIDACTIEAARERAHALRAEAMRVLLRAAAAQLLTPLRRAALRLACRRRRRLATRELARIGDGVLADIGIRRSEIEDTVAVLLARGECGCRARAA